jgi:predicted kinase
MKKTLIMLRGLPASGKTTWALDAQSDLAKLGDKVVIVCKDDIRAALGKPWSQEIEKEVIKIRNANIHGAFAQGANVVISADTNFGRHENDLSNIAKGCKAYFEVKDFTNVPLDVCLDRDSKRANAVGEKVIKDMYNKYIAVNLPPKPYVADWEKPIALICDLDGTLAIHQGRSPYEYDKCDTDKVNEVVANIVSMHRRLGGYTILYVSGREDSCREKTQEWLNKAGLWHPNTHLLMRKTGDMRNDAIVKLELFDNEIRTWYNVRFVLDDRDRVVKMWRSLGLTCLQVAEGNF